VDVDQLFVFRMIRLESRSAAESRYLFGSRFRMQNVLRRQHLVQCWRVSSGPARGLGEMLPSDQQLRRDSLGTVYKFSRVVDMLIAHLAHVGTASDFVSVTSSRWKSDA